MCGSGPISRLQADNYGVGRRLFAFGGENQKSVFDLRAIDADFGESCDVIEAGVGCHGSKAEASDPMMRGGRSARALLG